MLKLKLLRKTPELSELRISMAMTRVNDLWPENLGAVPGTHEVFLKQDADTIRAALRAVK